MADQQSLQPFVFMGGTFDPVHNGHLRTALEIKQWLGVDHVCLIPSKMPVHRDEPGCTSEQRLEMVRLAVEGEPALSADAREILSDKPSYSLLTLESLREEFGPKRPICMLLGMDAFLSLPSWYEWQRFSELCHIIVVTRPGYNFEAQGEIGNFIKQFGTQTPESVWSQPAGSVLIHEQTPLGISATQIRKLVMQGHSPRYLLPETVWNYIRKQHHYGYSEK